MSKSKQQKVPQKKTKRWPAMKSRTQTMKSDSEANMDWARNQNQETAAEMAVGLGVIDPFIVTARSAGAIPPEKKFSRFLR